MRCGPRVGGGAVKIVDRNTFLAMPQGTVYQKYEPCVFGELEIKGETLAGGIDWFAWTLGPWFEDTNGSVEYFDLLEHARVSTEEIGPMDFEIQGRDGCFDEDQLFAVWSKEDVEGLVRRLVATLPQSR